MEGSWPQWLASTNEATSRLGPQGRGLGLGAGTKRERKVEGSNGAAKRSFFLQGDWNFNFLVKKKIQRGYQGYCQHLMIGPIHLEQSYFLLDSENCLVLDVFIFYFSFIQHGTF